MNKLCGLAGVELFAIENIDEKIEKYQKQIDELPISEERDNLIKQREILKWTRDTNKLMCGD